MLLTGTDVNCRWSTDRASYDVVVTASSEPDAVDFMKRAGESSCRRAFGRSRLAFRLRWPIDVTCRSGKG